MAFAVEFAEPKVVGFPMKYTFTTKTAGYLRRRRTLALR